MAPADNFDVRRIIKLRAAIVALGRNLGKICQHVNLSQRQRRLADAAGLGGNGGPQFRKNPALDFDDFFLGV